MRINFIVPRANSRIVDIMSNSKDNNLVTLQIKGVEFLKSENRSPRHLWFTSRTTNQNQKTCSKRNTSFMLTCSLARILSKHYIPTAPTTLTVRDATGRLIRPEDGQNTAKRLTSEQRPYRAVELFTCT